MAACIIEHGQSRTTSEVVLSTQKFLGVRAAVSSLARRPKLPVETSEASDKSALSQSDGRQRMKG